MAARAAVCRPGGPDSERGGLVRSGVASPQLNGYADNAASVEWTLRQARRRLRRRFQKIAQPDIRRCGARAERRPTTEDVGVLADVGPLGTFRRARSSERAAEQDVRTNQGRRPGATLAREPDQTRHEGQVRAGPFKQGEWSVLSAAWHERAPPRAGATVLRRANVPMAGCRSEWPTPDRDAEAPMR